MIPTILRGGASMAIKTTTEDLWNKMDAYKREFLEKLIMGTSFTAPVMLSFPVDGLRGMASYGISPECVTTH
jgi:hypothetical protein